MYVSQPEVKPGCVLRRANFNVLERRGLVDDQQVQVGGYYIAALQLPVALVRAEALQVAVPYSIA